MFFINKQIVLVENEKLVADDEEVANTMNKYFSNVIPLLNIQGYISDYLHDNDIDEISNAINRFENHPSVIKIKNKTIITEPFFFSIPNVPETFIELAKLNKNKPTTDNNIPPKILKENGDICAPFITKCYEDSINKGQFPSALKNADITPGQKKVKQHLKITTDQLVFYQLSQKYLKEICTEI